VIVAMRGRPPLEPSRLSVATAVLVGQIAESRSPGEDSQAGIRLVLAMECTETERGVVRAVSLRWCAAA